MAKINIQNQTQPVDTPPSGYSYVYVDSSVKDGRIKLDDGTVKILGQQSLEETRQVGDTFAGNVNMGSNRLTNLASPSADGDAVNKAFMDAAVLWDKVGSVISPKIDGDNVHLQTGDLSFRTSGALEQSIIYFEDNGGTTRSRLEFTDDGANSILQTYSQGVLQLQGLSSINVISNGEVILDPTGGVRLNKLTANQGLYLNSSKVITNVPPTTGNLGFWNRTGSTLSPSTTGDDIKTSGDILLKVPSSSSSVKMSFRDDNDFEQAAITFQDDVSTGDLEIIALGRIDIVSNNILNLTGTGGMTIRTGGSNNLGIGTNSLNIETLTGSTMVSGDNLGNLYLNGATSVQLPSGSFGLTASVGDNSTKLATTAYVENSIIAGRLWDRSGGVLSPRNIGDNVSTTGNVSAGSIDLTGNLNQIDYPSNEDLLLYLPMTDYGTTQYDRSPYGKDGTVLGTNISIVSGAGRIDNAGLVNAGDLDALVYTSDYGGVSLDDYTISFFVKLDVVDHLTNPGFVEVSLDPSRLEIWSGQYFGTTYQFKAYMNDVRIDTGYEPVIDTWYHIAVVRKNGTWTYYVDLNPIDTGVDTTIYNLTQIAIAGRKPGEGNNLDGKMSEFMMYKRALSLDELRTEYLRKVNISSVVKSDNFRVVDQNGDTNFTVSSDGNINIPSLTESSEVFTDANKNLTTTKPTSGDLGHWNRTGTTLTPVFSTDLVDLNGELRTGLTSLGTVRHYTNATANFLQSFGANYSGNHPLYITGPFGATGNILSLLFNNVGVGTVSPSSALHIGDNFSSEPTITLGDVNWQIGLEENYSINNLDNMVFKVQDGTGKGFRFTNHTGDNLMYIDASAGRVGIGKTNPANPLDVNGTIESLLLITEGTTGALHTLRNLTANASAFSHWYNSDDTVRMIVGVDGSGFSGATGQAGIGTWTNHPVAFFANQKQSAKLTNISNVGVFVLQTAETTVVDGDLLGALEFQAPLEASGTDAVLVGAAIWAEADDTFAADNNTTDLVFATATSGPATEKMRIKSNGEVSIGSDVSIGGDLHWVGEGSGLLYGSLIANTASAVAIISSGVYIQFVGFNANGQSNGTTPDHTNDHITVPTAGKYLVTVDVNASVISGSGRPIFMVHTNNGTTQHSDTYIRLPNAGTDNNGSMTFVLDLTANDTVELWVQNDTDTGDFLVERARMTVIQIAGT